MTAIAIIWAAVWLGWKIDAAAETIADALSEGEGDE